MVKKSIIKKEHYGETQDPLLLLLLIYPPAKEVNKKINPIPIPTPKPHP